MMPITISFLFVSVFYIVLLLLSNLQFLKESYNYNDTNKFSTLVLKRRFTKNMNYVDKGRRIITAKNRNSIERNIKIINTEGVRNERSNTTVLFIIINCRNASYIPEWLNDCTPPSCAFQAFGDYNITSTKNKTTKKMKSPIETSNVVAYPESLRNVYAYSSFGHRARYQMEWALANANFDWLVKVDDDGYLCINTLVNTLHQNSAPINKFILGRFWCKVDFARLDENFLVMSSDVVRYFVEGWKNNKVKFDGGVTLGMNIGVMLSHLHHTCQWTFWTAPTKIRWSEKIKMSYVGCHTHIWLHHLKKKEIKKLHRKQRKQILSEVEANDSLFKNHTGCQDWNYGIPSPKPKRLANVDIKYGTAKNAIRFKKVDFTNGTKPPCDW